MPRNRRRSSAAKMSRGEGLTEIGSAGVRSTSGRILDDVSKMLRTSRQRYKLYSEIRDNSAPIGAARLAIEQLLRQTPITVTAASDEPADIEARDFVRECLHDMSRTWDDTLAQSLSMLDFGYAPMEIVYKIRGGEHSDARRRSAFSDGKIGWRKIALRSQATVDRWEIDDSDGGFSGLYQRDANSSREVFIPIEKLLLFRTRDNGSPEGVSVYRNCAYPWTFAKRLQEIEAIGIERDLTGIPVMYVPEEITAENASAAAKATFEACKRIATTIHRNEHEGMVLPQGYDQHGNQRYKLELLTTGGRRALDVSAIIERHEQRMLMCLLADFILLGHEQVGSFSLSSDKTDLFAVAIGSWLGSILSVWNRFAIPRLLAMNGTKAAPPKMVHGDIEKRDIASLGTFIANLAGAGIVLDDSDGAIERHVREVAGMPLPAMDIDDAGAAPIGKRSAGVMGAFLREVRELRREVAAKAA